jgi:hypothetical protein
MRSRSTLATFVAAALLVPAVTAPDASHAARGMELALQDDATFVVGNRHVSREEGLELARAIGVTRLRVNLLWAYTMPAAQASARTRPATINYSFDQINALIDAAGARGIRVHLSLTGPAPRWANARKAPPKRAWYKPDARAFGEFARVVAEHFKGRVDRYSIWNEPNWKTWLGPLKSAPALYRALYTRGYAAIKQADPSAKVLIGETSPFERAGFSTAPLAFLRQVTCVNRKYRRVRSCAKLKADGYAHHPYDFAHRPTYRYPGADNVTIGTLRRLTRALDRMSRAGVLRRNGGGRMPVYLTEYGYFATGHRALPVKRRTRYLQQGFSIALRNPRVKSQLQYLLVSPPARSTSAFFNLALLDPRGGKYPQYRAVQRWFRANRGTVKRPAGPIALPPAPPNPNA